IAMMHGALYYRLAAGLASAVSLADVDVLTASLIAGRTLTLLATIGVFVCVGRLANLDGGAPRGGPWSVALLAARPGFAAVSTTVRPDMLGVAAQTLGLLLILTALRGDEALPGLKLGLAYGCFALAFLIKQHNLAVPAVSSALLLARMVQGRIRLSALMLAHAIALVLVL